MRSRMPTVLTAAILIASCGDSRLPEYELAGPVMGTTYSIKLVDPPGELDRDELGNSIRHRLEDIEQRFSTYRPSSELSRVNAALTTEWIPVSNELCSVIESAIELSRVTYGAFDITVGPLVLLWGFGPDSDRVSPPVDELIIEARGSVGFDKLDTDCSMPAVRKSLPGVSIDLSAFAKGFAVDEVTSLVSVHGAENFLVEIGGELCTRGHNADRSPWAIAIEKPDATGRSVQSVVNVTDQCLATSGDYRNFFEHDGVRYSHTLDPETGWPVTHDTAAVTVIAESAARADGLATALLVHGVEDGLEFADNDSIAAFFLVRQDDGLAEQSSSAFAELAK